MSSVNFKKIKSASEVAPLVRHNDKEERTKHTHSNEDIDISKTAENLTWRALNYAETVAEFNARIKHLDETTNTNHRSDRVVAFALNAPIPKGIPADEFFSDFCQLCEKHFGKENVVNSWLHLDEIHEYIGDNLTVKESLPHVHVIVIPEINGSLCGKKFSAKKAMTGIDKTVDKMCRENYGVPFLTGGTVKNKSVEELKTESEQQAELLQRLQNKEVVTPKKKGFGTVTIEKKDFDTLTLKAAAYEEVASLTDKQAKDEKKIRDDLKKALAKKEQAENEARDLIRTIKSGREKVAQLDSEIQEKEDELADKQEDYNNAVYAIQQAKPTLTLLTENAALQSENNALRAEITGLRGKLENILEIIRNEPISALTSRIRQALTHNRKDVQHTRDNDFDR